MLVCWEIVVLPLHRLRNMHVNNDFIFRCSIYSFEFIVKDVRITNHRVWYEKKNTTSYSGLHHTTMTMQQQTFKAMCIYAFQDTLHAAVCTTNAQSGVLNGIIIPPSTACLGSWTIMKKRHTWSECRLLIDPYSWTYGTTLGLVVVFLILGKDYPLLWE